MAYFLNDQTRCHDSKCDSSHQCLRFLLRNTGSESSPHVATLGHPCASRISGRLLPCSELAVGHCVIIDQCDQPSGKCVAVITKVSDGRVDAEYLCCESGYGKCFTTHPEMPTPVGLFGIQIVLKDSVYSCQVVGESGAQYRDGRERLWQEHVPYFHGAKKSLLKYFA